MWDVGTFGKLYHTLQMFEDGVLNRAALVSPGFQPRHGRLLLGICPRITKKSGGAALVSSRPLQAGPRLS